MIRVQRRVRPAVVQATLQNCLIRSQRFTGKADISSFAALLSFETLAPYWTTARILDLGCGNGIYFVELCKLDKRHRPVGMDLSAGMLAKAGQRLGDRADLVRGDAIASRSKRTAWMW